MTVQKPSARVALKHPGTTSGRSCSYSPICQRPTQTYRLVAVSMGLEPIPRSVTGWKLTHRLTNQNKKGSTFDASLRTSLVWWYLSRLFRYLYTYVHGKRCPLDDPGGPPHHGAAHLGEQIGVSLLYCLNTVVFLFLRIQKYESFPEEKNALSFYHARSPWFIILMSQR